MSAEHECDSQKLDYSLGDVESSLRKDAKKRPGSMAAVCVFARAQEKSLYERVGGFNALAAVVDDFVGRLVADKQFEKFFAGHSIDSKKRIRQHIPDQFCAATGGPCIYTGREMKTTHAGLGITEADWDAAAKHLAASLDKFKVPEKEKG